MEHEAFVVYVTAISVDSSDKMYPLKNAQKAHLKADKAIIKIPSKYADFANIFSPKFVIELPKYMKINNYAIE